MKKELPNTITAPKRKTNGKRNRYAGHELERRVVLEFIELGFPHVCTSRSENQTRDGQKVDIVNRDEVTNGRLRYNLQCKNTTSCLPYAKLLNEMPKGGPEINVIIHNHTKQSEGGRFVTKGQYAIMTKEGFYEMVRDIERYKKAFS